MNVLLAALKDCEASLHECERRGDKQAAYFALLKTGRAAKIRSAITRKVERHHREIQKVAAAFRN
jgi:hypothetical protein